MKLIIGFTLAACTVAVLQGFMDAVQDNAMAAEQARVACLEQRVERLTEDERTHSRIEALGRVQMELLEQQVSELSDALDSAQEQIARVTSRRTF